jgi:hypothetical protein
MEFQTEATVHNGSVTISNLPFEEGTRISLTVEPKQTPPKLGAREWGEQLRELMEVAKRLRKGVEFDPSQTWPREVIYREERV